MEAKALKECVGLKKIMETLTMQLAMQTGPMKK